MKQLTVVILSIFFIQCNNNFNEDVTKQDQKLTIKTSYRDFIGSWEYIDNPKNKDIPEGIYTIEIEEENNKLVGRYCAISESGNRIDCSTKKENNLQLKYNKRYLNVNFYSFFGAKGGKAIIKLDNNKLDWEILKNPEGGKFYMPNKVVFVKTTHSKKESNPKKTTNNQEYECKEFDVNIYENPLYKICECKDDFLQCYSIFYSNSEDYYRKMLLKKLPKKDTIVYFGENFPYTEYKVFKKDSINIRINEEGGGSEYKIKKKYDKTIIEFYAYPP